ncbi:MAG: hypothetical protein QOF30_1112, partial [Acidimicrobiaceae bacterium]|nr:hypothetical protein [Acidimicrobiaceae bacterium]
MGGGGERQGDLRRLVPAAPPDVHERPFKVIDVVEILVHRYAGRRIGEVSSSLGVNPKTVRSIWPRRSRPGWPRAARRCRGGQWAALVEGWFPDLVDRARRQSSWPEI